MGQQLQHPRSLAEAVRKAKLHLDPRTCALGVPAVKYLGHVVTWQGISCVPDKLAAIDAIPVCQSLVERQRFMGNCQYYRRFIPNFSSVAVPLFANTKNKALIWTPQYWKASKCLKEELEKEPVLAHPDYDKDFYLDCDGSHVGLGAVLLQHEGGDLVVAYASRSLRRHEKNLTATELKAAALIWTLEVFRPYVHGIRVIISTDHAPLEYIKDKTAKCARLKT